MNINNEVRLGDGELVESNAELRNPSQSYKSESVLAHALAGNPETEISTELRNPPVGIGACLAHLMHALAPTEQDRESYSDDQDRESYEPCRDFYRDPRDPEYNPEHDMMYVGEACDVSFYKCRKCGFQSEV